MRYALAAAFCGSFLLSIALVLVVRRVAVKIGFVDKPGGRKKHEKPTALGGGVAIALAASLPLLAVGLAAIAEEQGLRMNQLAILWLVAKPHATTIILGGTKPEHFTQILEVADRRLPEDVVERIDELSAPRVYTPFMNQSFRNAPGLGLNR